MALSRFHGSEGRLSSWGDASEVDRIVPWHWNFSRPDLPFVNTARSDHQLDHGERQQSANVSLTRRMQLAAFTPIDCRYFHPCALSSHLCGFGSLPKFPTLYARDDPARLAPDYAASRTSTMCWQIITTHFEHTAAPCGSALQVPMSILRLRVQGANLDYSSPTQSAHVWWR
jgi:hypothetical protein